MASITLTARRVTDWLTYTIADTRWLWDELGRIYQHARQEHR